MALLNFYLALTLYPESISKFLRSTAGIVESLYINRLRSLSRPVIYLIGTIDAYGKL